MDFITHLPNSQNRTVIMVVVDRFSKGVHFGALPSHVTAYKVTLLFLDIIYKLHGFPRSIVSDRDLIFVSQSETVSIKQHHLAPQHNVSSIIRWTNRGDQQGP